jgi:FKBP-type peptidyl-prolyl cis-trans isomerase SlyD
MEVADGRVVTVEYTVRLANGRLLDSTGRCGPIAIMVGSGQLFPALEDRILGLEPGNTREIVIPPEEAYGPWQPSLVRDLPRDRLSPDLELEIGRDYTLKAEGKTLRFRVVEFSDDVVRADFNGPNAGQALHARVTIVDVRAPTPEEERRGRVG